VSLLNLMLFSVLSSMYIGWKAQTSTWFYKDQLRQCIWMSFLGWKGPSKLNAAKCPGWTQVHLLFVRKWGSRELPFTYLFCIRAFYKTVWMFSFLKSQEVCLFALHIAIVAGRGPKTATVRRMVGQVAAPSCPWRVREFQQGRSAQLQSET
jgi:hypothetical protein